VIDVAFVVFRVVLATLLVACNAIPSMVRWVAGLRGQDDAGRRPASPGSPATVATIVQAGSYGECAEAVLAAWLLAGRLSEAQYREGMAILAEREALRRPLVVPPDCQA
jgi:hypothetical protein